MATYAIGDLQGCFRSLTALVASLGFDANRDRLWLVGDLINRGPRSLETLRWVHEHRRHLRVVLGNHDLNLLRLAYAGAGNGKRGRLDPILRANDRETLVSWLREQPLLHAENGWVMVHAGLLPEWTVERATRRARAAEDMLRSDRLPLLVARHEPADADAELREARETISVLTRLRMVDGYGRSCFEHKGVPADAPPGQVPWFEAPSRQHGDQNGILFGHWAALGRHLAPPYYGLDSGCVWGQELTAYRLEDGAVFTQPNVD